MKKILICCLACFSVCFSSAQRIPPSRLGNLQTRPTKCARCYGERKVYLLPVGRLLSFVKEAKQQGIEVEHVFDY